MAFKRINYMEPQSLEKRLYEYIKNQKAWIPGFKLENTIIAWGYSADNGRRKLRHLEEIGTVIDGKICKILKDYNEKRQVIYTCLNDNPARPSLNRIFQNKMF